ncbi:MAG TPA: NAD-dependent epimerase/dehydratase family protein [Jatrophihabitans sp.]|jgi:uncharacterized protein YbjT (DUF2867 family)|uniref:SDR family oxidoreductase n=1 Tax=Jatrophihabitans sp. TaxID=1932789 RepID=UPI002E07A65D|nr:NAD-dependent epimerase/dehydratase family protein [Jatrophihabitans sp.]
MRVAVVGGTGVVGRYVVPALRAAGHEPVVVARSLGVDVTTGAGLDAALERADGVVNVSNVTTASRKAAVAFFEAATTSLLDAGFRAGVRHHVILSIVGIDRVDLGYYAGKRRQEQLALDSGRPVTILRATQFHEFAEQTLDRFAKGPLAVVPRMRTQPVAAREVAGALAALVAAEPVGLAPELAGPEVRELPDLVRAVLQARARPERVLAFRLPGRAGRAMVDGGLLPSGDGPRGTQTFDQWLRATAPA